MNYDAAIRDLRFATEATAQAIRAGEMHGPKDGLDVLKANNAQREAALGLLERAQKGGSAP